MCGRNCFRLLAIAALAFSSIWLHGQAERTPAASRPKPPVRDGGIRPIARAPLEPRAALHHLVHAAGIIFSGTVTDIERHPGSGTPETVSITFHVENAIRGVAPGETLTISQWMGLWSGGQRYRVGERVLLFLYPASRLGLTSSVAGPMGRFEMDASRRVLISEQHRLAFRGDPVLGGKSRVAFRELALAVRKAATDERPARGGVHEN